MCPVWCRSEKALDALASAIKGNADISAVLVKTIAVDALYAARVRWIDRQRVAVHVQHTLADRDVTKANPDGYSSNELRGRGRRGANVGAGAQVKWWS
jgi:hypothetical protein